MECFVNLQIYVSSIYMLVKFVSRACNNVKKIIISSLLNF